MKQQQVCQSRHSYKSGSGVPSLEMGDLVSINTTGGRAVDGIPSEPEKWLHILDQLGIKRC